MVQRRWLNKAQPQTLQVATFLLYANAAFILLFLVLDKYTAQHAGLVVLFDSLGLARIVMLGLAVAQVAAGYGLANERKWAFNVALPTVGAIILLNIYAARYVDVDILAILFDIALMVALVHPQTRDYQKIWFK